MDWCKFNEVTPLPGTWGYLPNMPHVPKYLWPPLNPRTRGKTFEVDMSLWDSNWGMPAFIAYKRMQFGLELMNARCLSRLDRAFSIWHPYDYEQDVRSFRNRVAAQTVPLLNR
jgi:hypothetical protein